MAILADRFVFLRQLVTNPRQVSALAPSSRALARAMARGLGTGRVVEFGPGTGRLTEAILAQGVAAQDLTLIEMNPEFARHLRARFPALRVIEDGAQNAAAHVAPGVAAVVSGLPLLSMPVSLRRAIIGAAFQILAPTGQMVQFTYGPQPPLPPGDCQALGLAVDRGERVWANLPPATVYRFRRA